MNKRTAIALAIAGTIAAPMASADVYVSARMGVQQEGHDDATKEGLTFGNLSSRMGWKSETDLGNGMTAFGHLEVSTSNFGLRNLHIGMKGDFGSIKVGESTYAAFYNHVTGPVDYPYWTGGGGLVQTGRTADVINYSGSAGAVSFGVALEADGPTEDGSTDDSVVGTQLGVSIGLGDWTLGLGTRDAEDAASSTAGAVTGVTISGNLGDTYLAASMQSDDNNDGIQVHAQFGAFFVNWGTIDTGTNEPSTIAVGYAQSIGKQTSIWAEYGSTDSDGGADSDVLAAALRYDFY